MRDIPVFTSPGGTAALILREIPHRGEAYVRLLTVAELPLLAADCETFCRMCGASSVLMTQGPQPLSGYPHAYDTLRLGVEKSALPPPAHPAALLPMAPENDAIYQRVYNRAFAQTPGAATYDRREIRRIYQAGQQAFLALGPEDQPIGVGELHGSELAAIGLLPEYQGRGLSRDLALTLLALCPGPEIALTVASNNAPALGLYDALGFRVRGRVAAWYTLGDLQSPEIVL